MSLRIKGSTTGYTYERKGTDIVCYDENGKKIDKSVFLEKEGLKLNSDGKFVRESSDVSKTGNSEDSKGKKVNVTEDDLKNMVQVAENYCYKFADGKVSYYHFDSSGFTKISGADFKAATGGYVKKDGSFITEAEANKASSPNKKLGFWDKAKAFGKGMVKSVTNMFTDKNGKFSWKQTLKTVGTAVAVVGIAAVAVAAGVVTGGAATAIIVGAGVAMGAGNVIKGAMNLSEAQTDEETLAAYEQMGTGTGEIGMAILTKRPMASSMKAVSMASKAGRMEALASGSGRVAAWAKGVGAGVKTVVPSPKQAWEGVRKGTETVYDTVRHPRTAFRNMRQRSLTRESIKGDVETIRTQEDFVAARERVNNSDALSARQKAKLNKKLDKINREELPHEDIAALRERANDTSLSARERSAAQKEYNAAIKRSTDRAALEEIQNEGVSEFNGVDEAGFRTKVSEADPAANNDALINSIKKNETLSPEVKAELLSELEGKGIKLSERGQLVEKRIAALDKSQRAEFNDLISQAELKSLSRTQKAMNKVKTKKHQTKTEYDTIKERIETEVTDPKIKAELLKKLEAKQKLLDDIGVMKKHPEFKEYQSLIKRAAGDEYALSLLEKKLASDHSFLKSPTTKAQRSKLYREIYKEQNKINAEKYPDIEVRLKAKEQENLIKDAEKELAEIKRDVKNAERKANPDKVQEELTAAEQRLAETETTLRNELAELKGTRSHEHATNGTRQSEINETLRQIEQERALIREKQAELARNKTTQEQYEDTVSELARENNAEIAARQSEITQREDAIRELQKKDAFYERHENFFREQREFLEGEDGVYARQARGEIKQGREGIVEELQAKETSVQGEIDALRAELDGLRPPKKGLFESKSKFQQRQADYITRRNELSERIAQKYSERSEWNHLRKIAEKSNENYAKYNLDEVLYDAEATARNARSNIQDEITAKQAEIERLNREIETVNERADIQNENVEVIRNRYNAETERLNNEISKIETRISQREANVEVLRRNQETYRENIRRTNEKINEKKVKLEELEKETNPDQVKIKKLREELEDLRANHDRYQAEYDALNAKLTKKQASLERLKKSLAKKQEKIKTVRKAGGAFLGGVTGTQAIQEGVKNAKAIQNLMAALAMDEEEALEEEAEVQEESEVEEESSDVSEEEVSQDESSAAESDSGSTQDGNSSKTGGSSDRSSSPDGVRSNKQGGGIEPKVDTPVQETKPPVVKPQEPDDDEGEQEDNTLSSEKKNGNITLQTYINGRNESGDKRAITPAERMILTEQIQQAQTLDDIALIYSEMRSFNRFEGRKNLRKALKQKRKMIEAKREDYAKRLNKYEKRMDKIEDSKVYKKDASTVTKEQRDEVSHNVDDLSSMTVVEKRPNIFGRVFGGRRNELLLQAENSEAGVLISEGTVPDAPATAPSDGEVVAAGSPEGNPVPEGSTAPDERPPMFNDKGEQLTPEQAEEYLKGGGVPYDKDGKPLPPPGQEITAQAPVEITNPTDGTDNLTVEVTDAPSEDEPPELVAENTTTADVQYEDDEPKHKLDIDDGWGMA